MLAVIRPCRVTHCIPEISRGNVDFCPMLMAGDRSHLLQVMDADVITAIAGRINLSNMGRRMEVVFETSLDTQRAVMSFS